MRALPPLVRKGPLGVSRLPHVGSLDEALALVTEAIDMARRTGVSELAVLFPDMDDTVPATLATRLNAIGSWARVSTGLVRVAVVAPRHLLESPAYGIVHAAHSGLRLKGFDREIDALAWLLESAEAEKPCL
jgi:hypothetical protein